MRLKFYFIKLSISRLKKAIFLLFKSINLYKKSSAASIAELKISAGENLLLIPSSIILNSESAYDIEYLIYPLVNSEVKFEVNFYTSGTYINNNLNLEARKSTQL